MPTHPIIDRLADLGSEELTVSDVCQVLVRGRRTIERHLRAGDIESVEAATHGMQRGAKERRNRYAIPAAALLTFLVKTTGGDKSVILDAIRQRFPHHLPLCERVAGLAVAAAIPSNVIPMVQGAGRRAQGARLKPEHPDQMSLFHFPSQATA